EDINTYLPFRIVNPKFSHHPITCRMLLTHTSSIRDHWKVLESLYVWDDDSSISLGQFLESYLRPGGVHYHAAYNFSGSEPGTAFHYSNVGAALAAYLVEAVTGIPFDIYCSLEIFEPLGMKETSWRLADVDISHLAMPYQYGRYGYFSDSSHSSSWLEDRIGCFLVQAHYPQASFPFTVSRQGSPYHAYGFYAYPDYPDGLLKTSAPQLARFLTMFIQGGTLEGARILEPETVEEMKRVQNPGLDPQQGLIWYYKRLSGWTLLGHSGEDLGVATEMFFRPEDGAGVILLMNGDWSVGNEHIITEIETRLFRESAAF
ncbi:MAG: serine hydrolase domain-containing protein, partial [bacterium]